MTRFDTATAVTASSAEGGYTADLDAGYLIGQAMNGGYMMAVMQRAALEASPHPHAVSSSFNFLRPAGAGPAAVETEVLKAGRTVATVRVTLRQAGKPCVTGTLATAEIDSGAVPEYAVAAPQLPPMARCRVYDPRAGAEEAPSFIRRVAQYYTEESWQRLRGRAAEPAPDLAGYLHVSEEDGGPACDDPALFLPLAVDALPPVVTVFGSWRWAPTVELTWHMRAVPQPGPLMFRARADAVNDGWFDETVDLWDVKGTLVAQSRQLARSDW
ncbi:thioesterase family protein [Streptomonospora salina]|uniref:Acyl-coenzyme A thioesterase PaaI-like protein n=1 Tax=Streptomonospora salina TaxID=104205 RepID=A0A841EAF9_9ACTN|nr:thioesterase family protein [Streptomonospora salina]MBB5997500.1 acyl-coenzyme A thioesterase PaaI-like protein [Streptomonospora salina]